MSTKSIMQIPNEVIPILLIKRHKGSPHNNKLNLINIMPNLLELLNPIPGLNIGIIPGPDSPHTSRLIPRITLRTILKIRIRPTGTINTNIASSSNMRTPMRFAHHRHHSYTTGCSNRFGFQ